MNYKNVSPGIFLCLLIGLAGYFLSQLQFIPLDGMTLAIIVGFTIGNLAKIPHKFKAGISFSNKKILSWAIALLGFSLNYRNLLTLGYTTIFIILLSVVFTIGMSLLLGKILKIERDLSLLIGIGNAVCGSSAIAAAQGVLKTKEENVGIAVGTINLLGTVGIFLLPSLSMVLGNFSDQNKGILIGTTLQAVGQVAAAGFSLNEFIGQTATVVKMGRILLITPLILLLSYSKNGSFQSERKMKIPQIPRYILVFILLSIVNSFGFLDPNLVDLLKKLSKFLLMFAMAGIGLNITIKDLIQGGRSALLIGIFTWSCQIGFCIFLIFLFFL